MKKLPLKVFKSIYSQVPRVCVELLLRSNNKFLMVKRDIPPAKGGWFLPGGTVLFKESLGDTARRVAKEELGIEKYELVKLDEVIEWKDTSNVDGHVVSVIFLIYGFNKKDIKLDRQASEFKFFPRYRKEFPVEYVDLLV